MKGFQLVWWGWPLSLSGWDEDGRRHWGLRWIGWTWGVERMHPESSYSVIWEWRLYLGPLEIRRLVRNRKAALKAHGYATSQPPSPSSEP